MKPTSYLYVIANRSDARFLRREGLVDRFETLAHLTNPEARMSAEAFLDDKPGTVFSASPSHSNAYSPRTTVKEAQQNQFAQAIAEHIRQLERDLSFDQLILVAEPQMLGALKTALDNSCARKLTNTIAKDIASLDETEVSARLSSLL